MATASRQRRPTTSRDPETAAAARDARLAQLHTQLAVGVTATRSSVGWRAWLDVAARFPTYSLNNVLLVQAQRPGASMVCGYRGWQAMGRQVRKGEKGIFILAPILTRNPRNSPDPSPPETGRPEVGERIDLTDTAATGEPKIRPQRLVGFRAVAVFDVSQTDGDPLPTPPRAKLLTGEAPPGLWEALVAVATDTGFPVSRCATAADIGGANGITDFTSRTITVRADIDDAQATKTLAHELGHALQHAPQTGQPWVCRGTAEVEAESVAYLVAAHHGLDTSAYTFDYIAGWAPDDQTVTATANRVLQAARTVLAATDPTPEHINQDTAAAVTAGKVNTQAVADHATRTQTAATAATESVTSSADPAVAEAPVMETTAVDNEVVAGRVQATDRVVAAGSAGVGLGQPTSPPAASTAERAVGVDRIREINTAAAQWFTTQAAFSPEFSQAAIARGHDPQTLIQLGVGWAPSAWSALTSHLAEAGFALPELVAAGVTRTDRSGRGYDLFRGRIMFPVTDPTGAVAGFTGRDTTGRTGAPKYLNTPANSAYCKAELLYGTAHLTDSTKTVALVEGPGDALAVTLATHAPASPGGATAQAVHIEGAVPLKDRRASAPVVVGDQGGNAVGLAACGTAITAAHLELVSGLGCGIILCPDSDHAGLTALGRMADHLTATRTHPLAIRIPAGADLADMYARNGPAAVQLALAETAAAGIVYAQTWLELHPPTDQPHARVAAARAAAAHTRGLTPPQLGALASALLAGTALTPEAVLGVIRPPDAGSPTQRPPARPVRLGNRPIG